MKRNETIELNGTEYTLEINRDSAVKIEERTNLSKVVENARENLIEYIDEIDDNEDPFADDTTLDNMIEKMEEKEKNLHKVISVAFYIWLYPNHHLKYSKVKEILSPYFEDDEKLEFISKKYNEYMKLSSEISEKYIQELKNLKAQNNKKN